MTELKFQLEVDDGWPPVSVEGIGVICVGQDFRIASQPLFVKGLAVDDVIAAVPDAEGRVWEWQHVEKSKHSTIWIGRVARSAQQKIDQLLKEMRDLGCRTVGSEQLGCYSVDVPPECSIELVDQLLEGVDATEIGVAFPAFRHENDDSNT